MQPIIIICLIWVIWALTWMAVAIARDAGAHTLKGPLLHLYRLTLAGSGLLLFTITPWPGLDVQYRFWDRAPSEELGWVLAVLTMLGFVLAWWATIARLIAHRRHAEFAENGPYRYVRQPIYLGLIIAAFATAVLFGRPSAMAGATAMTIAFLVKILLDERSLREELPAYDDYTTRVRMLLPVPKRGEEVIAHASFEPEAAKPATQSLEPVLEAIVTEPEADLAEPEPVFAEPEPEIVAPEPVLAKPEPIVAKPEPVIEVKPEPAEPKLTAKAVQLSLSLDDLDDGEAERDAMLFGDDGKA